MDDRAKLNQLFEQRNKIVADQRKMLDMIERQNRDFTAEEEAKYTRMDQDFEALSEQTEKLRAKVRVGKLEFREEYLGQSTLDPALKSEVIHDNEPTSYNTWGEPVQRGYDAYSRSGLNTDEMRQFDKYLRFGKEALSYEERNLMIDHTSKGGYLLAPAMWSGGVLTKAKDVTTALNITHVEYLQDNVSELDIPMLSDDIADATWDSELKTGDEDSDMDFALKTLRPHPLAKRLKASNRYIRKVPNAAGFIQDRMGYKFGITIEKSFMEGTGVNEMLGVFTANDSGIGTAQDVSTGNTQTQIKGDNLIRVQETLKAGYQKNAMWIFHRDAMRQIRTLKTGEGQYLFEPGLKPGVVDQLLGKPVIRSEYCPNTYTTGLYAGIYGDFSYYWIAIDLAFQVAVLTELYAESNETGFIGRAELDGMPAIEEAFVRVKMG